MVSIRLLSFSLILLYWCSSGSAAPVAAGQNNTNIVENRQGWTSTPNRRGTLDIIWNCLVTFALCSWSTLCINVPACTEKTPKILARKAMLTLLCALAPEILFLTAVCQFISARESLALFAELNVPWNLTYGFYADMGGFMLYAPGGMVFPIDTRQLYFLAKEGYAVVPSLTREDIRDKDKADGLVRIITVVQTMWFTVNLCLRKAQHLTITTLELTTGAFIVCSFASTLCWFRKPADIRTSTPIYITTPLTEIREKAGLPAVDPHRSRTPLDFRSRYDFFWTLYWQNWINILRKMRLWQPTDEYPIKRISNSLVHDASGNQWAYLLFMLVMLGYYSILFAAWNWNFPTNIERQLWRAASTTCEVDAFLVWVVTEYTYRVWLGAAICKAYQRTTLALRQIFARERLRRTQTAALPSTSPSTDTCTDVQMPSPQKPSHEQPVAAASSPTLLQTTTEISAYSRPSATIPRRIMRPFKSFSRSLRNTSKSKNPALDVPLRAIIPLHVLGVFYCTARVYILVSEFIELRSLPESAYETVSWSWIIPHF